MKVLNFIQYLLLIFYSVVIGILWGGRIAGAPIPLGVLIPCTVIIAVRVLIGYLEITEDRYDNY